MLDDDLVKEDEQNGISGYIHSVSPIKQNDRQFKWFDCNVQFERGFVRAVSFDTSTAARDKFINAAKSKSPVKLTKFKLGSKRPGKPIDIILKKETKLDQLDTLSFPFKDTPQTKEVQIGNLNMFRAGQLLSLTAMVTNIQPAKDVTIKATNKTVLLQECLLTDPSGSIKLVVWENFVNKCKSGNTYKFDNLRLKSDNAQKSLSTSQSNCNIKDAPPFPDLQAPDELPSNTTTVKVEIHGYSQVSAYSACDSCNKRVEEHPQKPNLVKCPSCKITFNKKRSINQYIAKVVFQEEKKKIPLTCFHKTLVKIVEIHNQKTNSQVSTDNFTQEQLEDILCSDSTGTMTLTYNFTNYQILNIE